MSLSIFLINLMLLRARKVENEGILMTMFFVVAIFGDKNVQMSEIKYSRLKRMVLG